MATVYKCDRCGKEMEYRKRAWYVGAQIKCARLFVDDDEMRRYDYDLCADCGKALLKWMEDGKNDKA